MRNTLFLKALRIGVVITILFSSPGFTRVFFVGSNPYLSIIAFPQDVLLFPHDMYYAYSSYQILPWWGDMDEPTKKPNDSYIATAEKTIHDKSAISHFEHSAGIATLPLQGGMSKWLEDSINTFVEFGYIPSVKSAYAHGVLANTATSSYIPFSYATGNSTHELYLRTTAGMKYFDIPLGVKLQLGVSVLRPPHTQFTFNKDTREYSTSRLVWGWSTVGCSHIFGALGTDGDAWMQDEYSSGPQFRIDVQAGATVDNAKYGTRLRYTRATLDQYAWVKDSSQISAIPDQKIWQNFAGSYQKSPWIKKNSTILFRTYSNVTWKTTEHYLLKTLFFLGYEGSLSQNALSDNLSIEDNTQSRTRSLVIEVNPNISVLMPKHAIPFLDAALLCEYSYTRYSNTAEYGVNGGQKRSFITSNVYLGREYAWENFSYANEHFFDLGTDISLTLPILMQEQRRVALGLIMFINSKFTFQNKYFGTNTISNSQINFEKNNLRRNYKREIWFNTALAGHYWVGPYYIRVELIEPLLYSLLPKTVVTDASFKTVLFELQKTGTWASQEGVKLGIFVSKAL